MYGDKCHQLGVTSYKIYLLGVTRKLCWKSHEDVISRTKMASIIHDDLTRVTQTDGNKQWLHCTRMILETPIWCCFDHINLKAIHLKEHLMGLLKILLPSKGILYMYHYLYAIDRLQYAIWQTESYHKGNACPRILPLYYYIQSKFATRVSKQEGI